MRELHTHTIDTPKGYITVEEKTDSDYPGFYVMVNGVALAMVEYDLTNEQHAIRVWSHKDPENDPEYRQFIPTDFPKEEEE